MQCNRLFIRRSITTTTTFVQRYHPTATTTITATLRARRHFTDNTGKKWFADTMFRKRRTDWFETLFGFPEDSYKFTQENFALDGEYLVSKENGKRFLVGRFTTPSLESLRAEGRDILTAMAAEEASLGEAAVSKKVAHPDSIDPAMSEDTAELAEAAMSTEETTTEAAMSEDTTEAAMSTEGEGEKGEGSSTEATGLKEEQPSTTTTMTTANGMQRKKLRIHHISTGDVFLMHCDKDCEGAMFQAASQFNCLEFPDPGTIPEQGVTGYMYDGTQGPACSIAAGPATVYRNYFAPVNGQVGQTKSNQINNLKDLLQMLEGEDKVVVRNGYTTSDNAELEALNEAIQQVADREELLGKLRVGVHSKVEVPFSKRYKLIPEESERNIVSQTFCSALSIGYSHGADSKWQPLARIVLDATYEATLLAALIDLHEKRGSGKVYLTFVGGGVFGNRLTWIASAIGRACHVLKDAPLEVYVCHYGGVDSRVRDHITKVFRNGPDA